MDTHLQDCFTTGNVQLFVGSGLSKGLYPDSKQLQRRLLDEPIYADGRQTTLQAVLGEPTEVSLEDVAEFYELYQGPDALLRMIKKVYGAYKRPVDIHANLWKLPFARWIYTTNFDCLIENALGRPKQSPEVITHGTEISDISRNRRVVFKPHGCARRSTSRQEFVLTRNDYLNYSHRHTLEMLKTLYDISTRVFLFLGYSLRDLNMRHIITEASRIANVKSYAVLRDTLGPEARYWQKLGVTLIQQDADEFVGEVLKSFPAYEFEWDEKVDERVEEKEEISNKALLALKDAIAKHQRLTIIIDAGSTTLAFANALAREVLAGNVSLDTVRIVTNSPPAMEELGPALRRSKREVSVTIIGGPLRFNTRAYAPDADSAENQLRPFADLGIPALAFMGATAVDKLGLKTKTEGEVAIKKAFIKVAQEVYVLVDHSKILTLDEGHVFSQWDKERMTIITDRVKAMHQMRPVCKAIL